MSTEYQNTNKCKHFFYKKNQDLHILSKNSTTRTQILHLLYLIRMFSRKSGICFAHNDTFAEKVGISSRTIQRYIKKVENLGFIKITYDVNGKHYRTITITSSGNQLFTEKVVTPPKKVVIHNINNEFNIYNITTSDDTISKVREKKPNQEHVADPPVVNLPQNTNELQYLHMTLAFFQAIAFQIREEGTKIRVEGGSFDEIRKIDALEAAYLQKTTETQAKINYLKSQERLPKLSSSQLRRLKTLCETMGIGFTCIAKEIIFAITKGSLSVCRTTQKAMNFEMGFNIALKLLRERRWTVPVGYC